MIIEESGMQFGDFPEDKVFHIEKSEQYLKIRNSGVKTCEFILMRSSKLLFVEAKTTIRDIYTDDSDEYRLKNYNRYVDDIVEKMCHSLSLYISIHIARQKQTGVPLSFLENDLSNTKFQFVLVVKNESDEIALQRIKEKINYAIKTNMRIWKLEQVWVINEEKARQKGFII